jgi:DnaJ-class molecular chaperone
METYNIKEVECRECDGHRAKITKVTKESVAILTCKKCNGNGRGYFPRKFYTLMNEAVAALP